MKKISIALPIAIVIIMFLAGLVVYGFASYQNQARLVQADNLAIQSLLLRDSKFDLSLLLSVEAFHLADTPQTKSVLLDNVQSNQHLVQFLQNDVVPSTLAFSPDGKTLAMGGRNGDIELWDITNRKLVKQLAAQWNPPPDFPFQPGRPTLGSVISLFFSPDGKEIIASIYTMFADERIINVWDVASGKSITNSVLENTSPYDLLLSPDGRTLAISEWGHIGFWDMQTNQFVGKIPVEGFEGIPVGLNTEPVVGDIAFSPDGKTLAAITSVNTISFWDVTTLQSIGQPMMVGELYVENGVGKIAYTKDGKNLLAAYPDGTLLSWNLESRQSSELWHPFQTKDSWVLFSYSAGFSPDGSVAAVSDGNMTYLLDTQTGREVNEPLRGDLWGIAFSPNGRMLASNGNNGVIVWNLDGDQSIRQVLADRGEAVRYTPDGNLLEAGLAPGGFPALALWDPKSHQFSNELHPSLVPNAVAFSPDGRKLIAGDNDGTVTLWDVATQQSIGHLDFGRGNLVSSVVFSPDGRTIAVGSGMKDIGINLWDGSSSKANGESLNAVVSGESSLAFSPDGKILAVGDNSGSIILWDVTTRHSVQWKSTFDVVDSLAFSPDGNELATTSRDGYIYLWDVKSHHLLGRPFILPSGGIPDVVTFSPDGKILVSGNYDDTINLWDVASHETIGQGLLGNSWPVGQVMFSPDGHTLAVVSNKILLWDVDPQSWIEKICQRIGRNLTRDEWGQYFPGEPYHLTCPEWPAAPPSTPTPLITP